MASFFCQIAGLNPRKKSAALGRIKTEKAIVDGIRTADEIRELKKRKDAYIISVTSPQKLRYQRIRKRSREGDPKTFKEFKRLDNLENRGKTKGQEINKRPEERIK